MKTRRFFSSFFKKGLVRKVEMHIFAVRFWEWHQSSVKRLQSFSRKGVALVVGSGKVSGVGGVDLR